MKNFKYLIFSFLGIALLTYFSAFNGLKKNNHYYVLTARKLQTGLFSSFHMVLGALDFFDQNPSLGFMVDFEDKGVYFEPQMGNNWWNYYFEPIQIGEMIGAKPKYFTSRQKKQFSVNAGRKMSSQRANFLISKYIKIKPELKKKIDAFYDFHFAGKTVIGVHYRGTDKIKEAPRVNFDSVYFEILSAVDLFKEKNWKLFIATDDQNFLDYINGKWPDKIIATNSHRSKNEQSIHLTGDNLYQKGEEAVMDCLLLSKCDYLIKTPSNLSDAALQFNPNLPVVRLGEEKAGQKEKVRI